MINFVVILSMFVHLLGCQILQFCFKEYKKVTNETVSNSYMTRFLEKETGLHPVYQTGTG